MSTSSLPSYTGHASLNRIPSYSAEPRRGHERRLAHAVRPVLPSGDFVKESKGGGVVLRLGSQSDNVALPVYGSGGHVEGTVELSKVDGVNGVEVKIEGKLRMKEIAEGGNETVKLCLADTLLWIRDPVNTQCPHSLSFLLTLPRTFSYEGEEHPLPPTYNVKLSGLPGFVASIDYSVTAIVNKPNSVPSLVPLVKSSLFGIHLGSTIISTAFIYQPRSKPSTPLPAPLQWISAGFQANQYWKSQESIIKSKTSSTQDIVVKLYLPDSLVFCMSQPIPFHLSLESSAQSLALFLPCEPLANLEHKKSTRLQLMRQATVDVRNEVILGTKTDIWRVDCIGEGTFRRTGNGPTCASFSGEILVDETVKVPAFKAGGLSVKDCILLSMTPPDLQKSPFWDLRQVIPIRLTTDAYVENGAGVRTTLNHEIEISGPTPARGQ